MKHSFIIFLSLFFLSSNSFADDSKTGIEYYAYNWSICDQYLAGDQGSLSDEQWAYLKKLHTDVGTSADDYYLLDESDQILFAAWLSSATFPDKCTDCPTEIPLDGGLSFLLASGLGLGLFRRFKSVKK